MPLQNTYVYDVEVTYRDTVNGGTIFRRYRFRFSSPKSLDELEEEISNQFRDHGDTPRASRFFDRTGGTPDFEFDVTAFFRT